jgi:hypothetical protein
LRDRDNSKLELLKICEGGRTSFQLDLDGLALQSGKETDVTLNYLGQGKRIVQELCYDYES